jgi:hypothetical protein
VVVKSDVLSGDILFAIAEDRVDSIDRFYALIDKHRGTTVQLVLDRKGAARREAVRDSRGRNADE